MATTHTPPPPPFRLSEAELAQYERDGYVIPADFRLPTDLLERLSEHHRNLVARRPDFSDYCPALLPHDTAFLEAAREPSIVSMVNQLIGPDVALWNSSFFAKPAHTG